MFALSVPSSLFLVFLLSLFSLEFISEMRLSMGYYLDPLFTALH